MTGRGMALLAAARRVLAAQAGAASAAIVRQKRYEDVPLGQQAAHLLVPLVSERLTWPESPAWVYELSSFELVTLARGRPGTTTQRQLAELHESALAALLASEELLEVVSDGPSSAGASGAVGTSIAGVRWGRTQAAPSGPGAPLEFATTVALGVCIAEPEEFATLDGEPLFSSGPHEVVPGSRARAVADRLFNGLQGALLVDLGARPRRLVQSGRLSAASATSLGQLEEAIEARIDGQTHVLVDRQGTEYAHVRVERFERRGPVEVGLRWHRPYVIEYTAF